MKVDVLSRKGKGKDKGSKKGQESLSGKGHGDSKFNTRDSMVSAETGKYGHKAADCRYKQQHNSHGKGKSTGKSKSSITEISESDASKQVEEDVAHQTLLLDRRVCLKCTQLVRLGAQMRNC